MDFNALEIPGAYRIAPQRLQDERGFFARTSCVREFEEHGLCPYLSQSSISFNIKKGTLRGLHYQCRPYEECKIVRCTRGAIYDVILDIRPDSPAFGKWHAEVLTEDNRLQMYVPEGVAHGFQTLRDESEVYYMISEPHCPPAARGIRWNDPAFAIHWPADTRTISERDQRYPDFT